MPSISRAAIPALAILAACGGGSSKPAARPQPADPNTVTAADLERRPDEPIEKTLQRKVSGLIVTRSPSGDIALQIRGYSNFEGKNTPPLFILNDLPFNPGPGGTLTGINPYDIESIKVLRGAEAGLYGIEGANGVIVIKTKKGGKP